MPTAENPEKPSLPSFSGPSSSVLGRSNGAQKRRGRAEGPGAELGSPQSDMRSGNTTSKARSP